MPPPCCKRTGRFVKSNRKSKAPRRRAVRQQLAELPVIILEDDVDDPLNDSQAEEDDLEKAIISPTWPADFGKDISINDRTEADDHDDVKNLFKWPEHIAMSFETMGVKLKQRILTHVDEGIFTTTHWSGMGTAEDSLNFGIHRMYDFWGMVGPDHTATHWAATECASECQEVLLEAPENMPRHLFDNICHLIPQKLSRRMQFGLVGHIRKFERKFACFKLTDTESRSRHRSELLHSIGREWVHRAVEILSEHQFTREWTRSKCRISGRASPCFPTLQQIGKGLHIEISGSTCVAWSTMSKGAMGWLHESSIPFLIWACMMRDIQPNLIVHECVAKFDWEVLVIILGETFVVKSLVFGPDDVGFPNTRRRRYTTCRRTTASPFPGAPRFQMRVEFGDDFAGTVFRSTDVGARALMRCGRWQQLQYLTFMALRRHMPADWAELRLPFWSSLLSRGTYKRLIKWARLVAKTDCKDFFFFNIAQNPGFGASITEQAPALLRGSMLWVGGKGFSWRPVLLPELLAIQGFPVYEEIREDSPITQVMLAKMLNDQFKPAAKKIIGNSMHHACVGSTLLFFLAAMQRVV